MIKLNLEKIKSKCDQAITRDNWESDSKSTEAFKIQFSKMGTELGCRTQLEFLSIDLVWWNNGRMVAAIEHENKPGTNPIEDEWKKLTYIDVDYKILISYCTPEEKRRAWLKRAGEIVAGNPKGKPLGFYLILGDQNVWRFRGYEFDHSGNIIKKIEP